MLNFIHVQILGKVNSVKQLKSGKYQIGVVFSNKDKDFWINIITSKLFEKNDYIFAQGELTISEYNGKVSLTIFTDDVLKVGGVKNGATQEQ